MNKMVGVSLVVVLLSTLAVAQWTRPVGSGTWSSTPIQMFTLYGDVNVTNATWSEWFCLRDDCISAWPVGGGVADGNNYTTSISFNRTGSVIQLNLARTTMTNLTAQINDTDTYNTTTDMRTAVNNTALNLSNANWLNCMNINFSGTLGSASICDGNDASGAAADLNNYTISISINQTLNVTTLNMQRNNMTNLTATWTSYMIDTWNTSTEIKAQCFDICAETDACGYWDACADAYACGWLTTESDPQVDAIGATKWCRGDALGTAIDCDVDPVIDTNTWNSTADMRTAINNSGPIWNWSIHYTNISSAPWISSYNNNYTIAIGINQTLNVTTLNMQRNNMSNLTLTWTSYMLNTWNSTDEMRAAVNNSVLNLGNSYNTSRFNITQNNSAYVANNTKIHWGSNGGYMWMLYNTSTGALEIG